MQGWYGAESDGMLPYSWLAVAGQNPAYDHFPCQYQIWYKGRACQTLPTTSSSAFMTKCEKPFRHLATSSTKSSKWSVLIGRAGRLSTKSHWVSNWIHVLRHTISYLELSGIT
jgi:hypothetical protein